MDERKKAETIFPCRENTLEVMENTVLMRTVFGRLINVGFGLAYLPINKRLSV